MTTRTWSGEELARIGPAMELDLATSRDDGSLRPYVTIWVVRCGDDLYIRSAYGPSNPWFIRARSSHAGRIRSGGIERDVVFADPGADPDLHLAIDAAYQSKYDRFGPEIVGTVVGRKVREVTLQVLPA